MKVINISAMWCPSCLIMHDMMDDVLKEYNFDVISYDYDFDCDIVGSYNVGKILPVYIFFNGDKEIKRIVGEHSLKEVKEEIDKMIGSDMFEK